MRFVGLFSGLRKDDPRFQRLMEQVKSAYMRGRSDYSPLTVRSDRLWAGAGQVFDASTVDALTVTLDGMNVRVRGRSGNAGSLDDVDGTYEEGDTIATLTGETFDGMPITGTDAICIVP